MVGAAGTAAGAAAGSEQAAGLGSSADEAEAVTQQQPAWDTRQQQEQSNPQQQQLQQAPSAAATGQAEPVTILGVEHFSRPAADYYSTTALLDFASFIYLALFYQVLVATAAVCCCWAGVSCVLSWHWRTPQALLQVGTTQSIESRHRFWYSSTASLCSCTVWHSQHTRCC
jgi:hypothetical protein